MAADGPGVLENDLACDVHDKFFELYDGGADPAVILTTIRARYEQQVLLEAEREIVLAALTQCLWEVGQPVDEMRAQLEGMLTAGINVPYWGPLHAGRTRVLRHLLTKVSKPKKTPVARKKARLPKKIAFQDGDYLLFTKANGKVVPVVVWLVEKRVPLRYDFVFPNLGKVDDDTLVMRLLDTQAAVSDEELAAVLSKGKRPRVFTLEHAAIKPHLSRFRKFGNRPFDFAVWQCGVCAYGVTFTDFERNADGGGCRALTAQELAAVASQLTS